MSDDYVKAAPLCEKHQPNGGTRGMCVICAGESLQHALSRISYACEPPNEMQYSSFDVHMDETAVVAQVVAQAERIRVLREALEVATNWLSDDRHPIGWTVDRLRAALAQKAEPPSMPQGKSLALLDLDSVEHMQGGANGPTIRLRGFINAQTGPTAPQPPIDNAFVADGCEQFSQPVDIVNPISQQEPVAWRHSKTGRPYELEEEVPLADGDEWAEPLYATPATQQAPAAWRQWSTKLHDWDYQTNRGDLRPDTPADPLFVAAAQLVPLTDEQRNDRIEAWSSQGWGDRLGEVVRICIAIERAHGIAAAGDKP